MFENIIDQGASLQLRDDILAVRQAPSMLFFGPSGSGKGSAALEFARVLSCSGSASWKCSCSACERHRYLQHSDLLMMGYRPFQAEIAASSSAYLRDTSSVSSKTLFVRSLRKLIGRFSIVVMEDDPKLSKISSVLQSLEEGLNEFETADFAASGGASGAEKLCASLIKDAQKLENEGMSDYIPVGHIRRASWWCRLAPNGKRKTLVIENAERMKDEARNSLLKLLEEPPNTVSIVLTTQRREAVIPTILSRLRPYRYFRRNEESEREVIRRVFKDTFADGTTTTVGAAADNTGSLISAYLDSFLPQNTENLYPLAAYFMVSLARTAAVSLKKASAHASAGIPVIINEMGDRYAQIANDAGFERTARPAQIIKTILAKSGNFEDDAFSRFLRLCLEMLCAVMRSANDPSRMVYIDGFKKHIGEAETAAGVLNQNVQLTLEALFYKLHKVLCAGFSGASDRGGRNA